MPARMECASTGGTRSRKKKHKWRRLSKIAFHVDATKTVPASSRPASSTTLANCPRQPGAASKAWAMKCARIKAQPTIHSRTVREGACLRRDTKMPSKTQSTRMVGSLSSRELMKVVWGRLEQWNVMGGETRSPENFSNLSGTRSRRVCYECKRREATAGCHLPLGLRAN